jgi:uncharacterized membrane protein YqgA involved in biofilm formation
VKQTRLELPYVALIAGTRVALGIGVGLLLSQKLGERARRGAGWGLLAVGGLSTIPLGIKVLSGTRAAWAT